MREPFVQIFSGGDDLVPGWGPRLLEARLTDERGLESDKLTVTLDDAGGAVAYPSTGATIVFRGGYLDEGGAVMGAFIVDQITLQGYPQTIAIQATSVAAKSAAKERKTETHKKEEVPTLGDLADKLAGRNGWQSAMQEELRSIPIIGDLHQTESSDPAFLGRIVRGHDGMVAVKENRLVALLRGSLQTASGAAIEPLAIRYGDNLLSYRVTWSDRPAHGKVEARYYDRKKNETVIVEASVGNDTGDVVDRIREPFPTEEEAQQAADARARELKRSGGTASFEVEGDPAFGAEVPVTASGIRSGANGLWVPTRVEHVFASGYKTKLETETPGDGDSRGDDE